MVTHKCQSVTERSNIEAVAAALGCADERVLELARVIDEHGGGGARTLYGPEVTLVAALRVASERTDCDGPDPEEACAVGDADPCTLAHAETLIERELSPRASAETYRSLRRRLIAITEILAAVENGRSNAPRLPPSTPTDPALLALTSRPLETVDADALRAHRERLETDLDVARLGVRLHALVTEARADESTPEADQNERAERHQVARERDDRRR
ncbi:hypothetical protein [Natronobiforma cellulositropha]|uniref:hypothetical protein n=1 Tax=Natronobiforma cellulositropha TaxID=1679076 RepID=UPI0021D5E636|nr:hypothetical protein [Natronobiforma cellulositropha]